MSEPDFFECRGDYLVALDEARQRAHRAEARIARALDLADQADRAGRVAVMIEALRRALMD